MAMGLAGVVLVALYTGVTTGLNLTRLARENSRATQILIEKMEELRLFTWDQINSTGFVPTSFTVPFFPEDVNPEESLMYTGTLAITASTLRDGAGQPRSYASNVVQVDVTVHWKSGSILRTRSMSSLIARDGEQNYVNGTSN